MSEELLDPKALQRTLHISRSTGIFSCDTRGCGTTMSSNAVSQVASESICFGDSSSQHCSKCKGKAQIFSHKVPQVVGRRPDPLSPSGEVRSAETHLPDSCTSPPKHQIDRHKHGLRHGPGMGEEICGNE